MKSKSALFLSGVAIASLTLLTACRTNAAQSNSSSSDTNISKVAAKTANYQVTSSDIKNAKKLLINSSKWHYNTKNKVYYQVKVKYGTKTKSSYESMGIYIPAAYVNAKKSGKNTYKISINTKKKVNGYTAATAPIVMPINTPGIQHNKHQLVMNQAQPNLLRLGLSMFWQAVVG